MKFRLDLLLVLWGIIVFNAPEASAQKSIDQRVDSVLQLMTLDEKIGQMNQYSGFWNVTGPAPAEGTQAKKYADLKSGKVGSMLNVTGVDEVRKVQELALQSRLKIPLIIGFDVIHGYKTISPIPLAEAASWDMQAIEKSAAMAAKEAAAHGINWTFAPMVDISRDARWGRVMEGAGEDTFLGSQIAKARVSGFQGKNLASPYTVAATAKHFVGYGFGIAGRDYNTVDVGTATLYNALFPPFQACIEADVRTFMDSFNDLNGIPCTGNQWLLRQILKENWQFDGFVVSDWGSIEEMTAHGYAPNLRAAAKAAAAAGTDMDMESYAYNAYLKEMVKNGELPQQTIDDAVRRILKVKFELGLFDDPFAYCNKERQNTISQSQEIQEAALDMARKSIVLLKNENNILPLKKTGQNIALIGPLVSDKTSPLGNWRLAAEEGSAVSVLEGMSKKGHNNLIHAQGVELITTEEPKFAFEVDVNETNPTGIKAAVKVAEKADVVVMVLGEHGLQSGEARSRANLDLPGLQQELLEEVFKVNQNIVLVLMNGRPLAIPWAAKNIPAIVEAWHLGTQSGHAISDVLYGDYNPSGKLPMTFPRSVGQCPIYYNQKSTGRPEPKEPGLIFYTHYIDESRDPLFPFGFGLSYTSFSYSNMALSKTKISKNEQLTAKVNVTNTGKKFGKEIVQLYIQDVFGSRTRPVRELKGFELIELQPGESREVSFTINADLLQFFTAENKMDVEPGEFKVWIGTDSQVEEFLTFQVIK